MYETYCLNLKKESGLKPDVDFAFNSPLVKTIGKE